MTMRAVPHLWVLLALGAAVPAVVVDAHPRHPAAAPNAVSRPVAQAPSPAGRTAAALVYDVTRKEMLLWGGIASDGKTFPNDLWAWNGSSWRQLVPRDGVAPLGRSHHNLVYDEARRRVVLIGGRRGPGKLGDTWEWDGARWHEITSGTFPILHPTVVYDGMRRRVVLFGGSDLAGLLRKLMGWNGRAWEVLDSVGPPLAKEAGIPVISAVTPAGELLSVIEQSGRSSDSVALLTWTWNGTSWTRRELGPAMTSLQPAASAPDGTIYIYQSFGEWLTAPLVHTRSPAGVWTSVSPSVRPEPNLFPAAAYDPIRKRFVLYGNAYWEWDGARWAKRS
jgi:hypothetical protein